LHVQTPIEGIYNRSNVIEKKAFNSKPTNEANSGIHFRARLTSDLEATESTINILFGKIRLNHGVGSFDEKTGHFTVPKSGIHQITFSGFVRGTSAKPSNYPTSLFIMMNGAHRDWPEFITIIDNQTSMNQVVMSTMKLHQDQISIFIHIIGNGKTL